MTYPIIHIKNYDEIEQIGTKNFGFMMNKIESENYLKLDAVALVKIGLKK